VAVSALIFKLILMVPVIVAINVPISFLGPLGGIIVERRRGGTGITGGLIAGILSGLILSALMNLYVIHLGRSFSWFELSVSTSLFVLLEAFCGWFWGHSYQSWSLSNASQKVTRPHEHGP
jgi:hypothetical protein